MRIDEIALRLKEIQKAEVEMLLLWAVDCEFSPFILEIDTLRFVFKPISYRSVIRLHQIEHLRRSTIYTEVFNLRLNFRQYLLETIGEGLSLVEYKGNVYMQPVEFLKRLPSNEVVALSRLVFILNGLDEVVSKRIDDQLKLLEEISYAFYSNLLGKDKPLPSWASPLIMSFQVFRESGRWSASNPIDEPYLLWLAWLSIAKGENRYYEQKMQAAASQTASVLEIPGSVPSTEGKNVSLPSPSTLESLKRSFDLDDLLKALSE